MTRMKGTPGKDWDYFISYRFGGHVCNMVRFPRAVGHVRSYATLEHKACNHLVRKINEDHWITSFWSELIGGARAPAHRFWAQPLATLDSAMSAYRAGMAAEARRQFELAVRQYNFVHRQWVRYRQRLEKGATRSLYGIKITCFAMTLATGACAGSLVGGAAVSAGDPAA